MTRVYRCRLDGEEIPDGPDVEEELAKHAEEHHQADHYLVVHQGGKS